MAIRGRPSTPSLRSEVEWSDRAGAVSRRSCEGPDQTTADDEVVRHARRAKRQAQLGTQEQVRGDEPVMAEATEITSSGPAVSKATIR